MAHRYTLDDISECPMDYELPKVFPFKTNENISLFYISKKWSIEAIIMITQSIFLTTKSCKLLLIEKRGSEFKLDI